MLKAGKRSNQMGHPVLLDPVGAGASDLRTSTAVLLTEEIRFDVIRGNTSEIKTLAKGSGTTKGVDADVADAVTEENLEEGVAFAKAFARKAETIAAITGAIDLVSDGEACYVIRNGRPEMGKITGTGCQLSGMLTAFLVANPDQKLEAAAAAVCAMGLAGEIGWAHMQPGDATPLTGTGSSMPSTIWIVRHWIKEQTMKCDKKDLLLYAVTDRRWLGGRRLADQVEEALKGGVTFVQLREKDLDEERFLEEAREIKELCGRYQVPFVINDNVDIAQAVDADGVHVGQSDMEAGDVRARLGQDKIIGVSAQTVEQALLAESRGADYLGVGAVFATGSKADASEVDHETVKAICQAVHIPVIAIGGITRENVGALAGTGVCGAAVISAIFAQEDVEEETRKLKEAVRCMVES